MLQFSVSACLSLQFWGAVICRLTSLLGWLSEELLIFHFVQLLPVIRTGWLCLSSLHAGLETEVLTFRPFLNWVVLFLSVEF